MLLRLRVRGFKNLRDVDVRFGPLTCFVGPNGVGKSNIFDAIQFLRLLADEEIQRAAESVRSPAARRYWRPQELFWNHDLSGEISLGADMIVPQRAVDDFGQLLQPAITLLRYEVAFAYRSEPHPRLVLLREMLSPLRKGDAREIIGFDHSKAFRATSVLGKRHGGPFISSEEDDGAVTLHQDGGSRGRGVSPGNSPRTVLAGTTSADYPTVVAARREMSSWRSLHLEQSSLRTPDGYGDPSTVDELGRHIASTLHRLHRESGKSGEIYAEAATRLSALVPDVQEVRVHDDAVHEQRVVEVKMRGAGQWFRPRSLSDGTLRFLALITMELDGESSRALCMEEPENGISFHSIPRLIELLRDYAVDPSLEVDDDNPTRQVILNSHSPEVLKHLDATEVLFIDSLRTEAGPEALVRPVQCRGNWRRDARPVTFSYLREAMRGSPIGDPLTRQMVMEQEPSA